MKHWDDARYYRILKELTARIPPDEYALVMSQDRCELEPQFLGFINIYKSLSELIPQNKIVIDFGCYLAAQSYLFAGHRQYIGVDVVKMRRFSPPNSIHYTMSIKQYIENEVPQLFSAHDPLTYCAICSYVPDFGETELVRRTFPNVFCYYPCP